MFALYWSLAVGAKYAHMDSNFVAIVTKLNEWYLQMAFIVFMNWIYEFNMNLFNKNFPIKNCQNENKYLM